MMACSMKRLPPIPSKREKSIGFPNRTPTGRTATFWTLGDSRCPCRSSLPNPRDAGLQREPGESGLALVGGGPSGERVPSGYMPSSLPSLSSRSAVFSAVWAASASARSIGTCPAAV